MPKVCHSIPTRGVGNKIIPREGEAEKKEGKNAQGKEGMEVRNGRQEVRRGREE